MKKPKVANFPLPVPPVPMGPLPVPPPKPVAIGHLKPDERVLFRHLTVAWRKSQREAQRRQSMCEDAVDGFKENHPEVNWKDATGVDDETGDIMGKPKPEKKGKV